MSFLSPNPKRKLAAQICAGLAAGQSVAEIARELNCDRNLVYWHKNKNKRKKHRDSLADKVARFNKKSFESNLTVDAVVKATGMRCAFSGQLIDAEKDSFYLGTADGLPIVYLPEYHRLAKIGLEEHERRCLAFLERRGFTWAKAD